MVPRTDPLYKEAQRLNIRNRTKMDRRQLRAAIAKAKRPASAVAKTKGCADRGSKPTVVELKRQAKAKGIKGYSSMNKAELCRRLGYTGTRKPLPAVPTNPIKPRGSKAVLIRRMQELQRKQDLPVATKAALEKMPAWQLESYIRTYESNDKKALIDKLMHQAELENPSEYLSDAEYTKILNKYKNMNLQQLEKEYGKAKSRKTNPIKPRGSKAVLIRRMQELQRQQDLPVATKATLEAIPAWQLESYIRTYESGERKQLIGALMYRARAVDMSDASYKKLVDKYNSMSLAQLKKEFKK